MISIIKCLALQGLDGFIIDVQVDLSGGIPALDIIGLPDVSIREARERVRLAIKNSGFEFPSKKIVINLAPATLKKEGTSFDLAIAVAILLANGEFDNFDFADTVFLGELSLDGKINPVSGILPMCIECKKIGIKKIIVPSQNSLEASIVDGIEIYPVINLMQVVAFLNGKLKIDALKFGFNSLLDEKESFEYDFSEVKGQLNIKRAIEVAASGGHNCLLIGSPGSGKTMIAKRIPTILPNLSFEEALEVTKIHSIAGNIKNDNPLLISRPFRAPHHTISKSSLVGGGAIPKPGEISLAHNGVLFLDELTEFDKSTLEVLRAPLEDRAITISRLNFTLTFPCNFMLIASMNPCPCGYYGSDKECRCSEFSIRKYIGKISGPLLDRFDIQVEVSTVKYKNLASDSVEESSAIIRSRVEKARRIQLERYKSDGIYTNAELSGGLIDKYCKLDDDCKIILEKVFNKLNLSARAYSRILKVARTIADMENHDNIEKNDLLEAIQYRSLDKKYSNIIK